MNRFARTELLIGKNGLEKLNKSNIAIFGIGGVGSYVAEALARTGVGKIIIIDKDDIDITNINRQIHAMSSTVGKSKVEVMKSRMLDINPNIKVDAIKENFPNENINFFSNDIDYIVDAIDSISAKIELILKANELNIPIISSMGMGNKINPTQIEVSDIYKTSICPLAKVVRRELRKKNIKKLKVVYSKEEPININLKDGKIKTIGSISFVPSVAGLIMASEIVKDILNKGDINDI